MGDLDNSRLTMKAGNQKAGVRLRLVLGPNVAIGPGKADLLDAVARAGSIAAGGRELGMSYKRAWLLVDSMNRCFAEPLVISTRGGNTRGGASLTSTGERVLASFRRAQALAEDALVDELEQLRALAKPRQE
jgi:molybdate transport system regulatory protein